ncbi:MULTISPECIES: nicotinamide mononucleotide transporter family protein [unclassified Streptomyces]|uniref:nicotinamide mononucleotide transporter family protein n=1 Tax=unclassified Streptomyces TaxID=2593676 RepID=UPI00136C861C|nr:nicotinamide mononucleotide transporter family protein [Streptomyces sp. SHP 1-2]MCW5254041.1 nicotinamide mononucleotide transporter [Streptomyces sp. SHP 1-2]MYU25553.1 nicotinamide riboside transporter PnuC [Streptomyces sp. SID8352]
MNWLNSEAFALLGQRIMWSDMIGNVIGLLGLALGWRRSIWTWPAQFLSGLILFTAFATAHLSGSAGKQIVVMAVAAWGFAQWSRGRRGGDGSIDVRFATWRERGALLGLAAAGTLAVGGLFTAFPTLSWDPWPDAYIFVGTVVAMYAQARGMVEFWFAWLLVDLVGVPLNFANGFAFSGFVYVLYGALVLWGLRDWWLRSRAATRPAPEGAPA